ncbi:NAD-dependent epimerase/dehydratase family protein [Rhodopirellula sp. JC740]|uniref:NAD-dependent epimerase/dehydratase family protein n=1 Tax=Rhodopirellula halodulae TaxID=2894198 RepID=A0ABS8NHM7_9BACT|nr:NAD-dependent epimerase/dehydratase family protein [Rhodopirellula sp. JC740]MCC9643043.1 NAD-dependent epimerase/dehydratase family protein [Rhodopirellula sp. JC740]
MRVVVTGCSGFLGREIVRQLLQRGDDVVGLSRRETPDLVRDGMEHHRGDLLDQDYLARVIPGADVVVHTAAVAGVWGPWQHYFDNNVVASRHMLDACQQNDVSQLVYTSSPSVTFGGEDQTHVDESEPYPDEFLCHYPHTKSIAEKEILDADQANQLRTVALRPHLIWGPEDPHLIPRVLDRARRGRLRIIGEGKNVIDTVHVTNAAAAHLNAIDALQNQPERAAGRAYFITQDEPVNCWDWITQLCEQHDVPPPKKSISFQAAYRIGATLERIYRWTGRRSEPPMTRFVAAQLAKDHSFDISAAKERLGYRPLINMDEGLQTLTSAPSTGQ